MKRYISFFRIRLIAGLQYRIAAFSSIVTQLAWGAMTLLMYAAFYRSSANSFPMSFDRLASYIWLQQALLSMFMVWGYDNEIFESISSGGVTYELCRPCDIYTMWFVKNAAMRLSRAILRFLPVLLVGALLPRPFGLSLPESPLHFALFLISLSVGFLLVISFLMLIYISAFHTISPVGIKILSATLADFLGGNVLPIPFFPKAVRAFLNMLPFASMQNTPFLIYVGYTDVRESVSRIALQLAWLLALTFLGKLFMRRSLRKVVLQGGLQMLYLRYLSMLFKSRIQYKMSFLMTTLGQTLVSFTCFFEIYFMFDRFNTVDDYSFSEVLICFSIVLLAFSFAECFARGFDTFPRLIRTGELDRLLVRPRSIIFQVLTSNIEFSRIGRLVWAVLVLAYAVPTSGIVWHADKILTAFLMFIGGLSVFTGLFILYAGISFFTIDGLEFMNIFTNGGREFAKYPLSIYGDGVLRLLTYVIPIALFQYYPFIYLVGRSDNVGLIFLPLVGPMFILPCYAFFAFGLGKYRSTGS